MQVSIVPRSAAHLIMYDVDHMQRSLTKISVALNKIDALQNDSSIHASILKSVINIKNYVDMIDNANDFYEIGGFDILPKLLSLSESQIQAASADLIAELVQNNAFCQNRLLESNIPEQLLHLLNKTENDLVRVKALYAISCLCRHNQKALTWFKKSDGLLSLLHILQMSDKSIQMKAAFFLSYLVENEESNHDSLLNMEIVPILINLVEENEHAGEEYLLSVLLYLVKVQDSSKAYCSQKSSFKCALINIIKRCGDLPEYWESKAYSTDLLAECFRC